MSKLNELKPNPGSVKKKRIVGRGYGCKKGATAGKGHNGNKQRSGFKMKWGHEGGQTPLYKRMPIIRHINNFVPKRRTVTLDMLMKINKTENKIIDADVLETFKFIKANENYKIVCGRADKYNFEGMDIRADCFSIKAKEIIEKNGGKASLNKNI